MLHVLLLVTVALLVELVEFLVAVLAPREREMRRKRDKMEMILDIP